MAEVLTPDICIVGGGPGGIAAAIGAANHGVPVVLVEKGRMGGSNLAYGGVPSKALVAAAAVRESLRRGVAAGIGAAPLEIGFGKVHDHIVAVGEAVAPSVSAERLSALGIRVIPAAARFEDRRTLLAGDVRINARRFILAPGAVPALPPTPGMDAVEALTEPAAFDLTEKPSHLIVIGANGRGLELAQSYARLGVDVTVIDEAPALAGHDPELAALVIERLRAEGMRIHDRADIEAVARRRGGVRVTLAGEAGSTAIDGSDIIVMTGHVPNIEGLGLEAAGIVHDKAGIRVDRQLRTSNRRVYAIGDAVAGPRLANRAEYQAGRVLRAILYRLPYRDHPTSVPAVAFTDPALASVGYGEEDARRIYPGARVLRMPFVDNDRAQAERLPAGMIKVVTTGGGRILGAGIVGHQADEMIALWSLAVARRLKIGALADFVPPYPARAEISRRVAQSFAGPGMVAPWRRRIVDFLRKFG